VRNPAERPRGILRAIAAFERELDGERPHSSMMNFAGAATDLKLLRATGSLPVPDNLTVPCLRWQAERGQSHRRLVRRT